MAEFWFDISEHWITHMRQAAAIMEFLGAMAYEMSQANRMKRCRECLDLRILASMYELFGEHDFHPATAMALIRDTQQNLCGAHQELAEQRRMMVRPPVQLGVVEDPYRGPMYNA